MTEEKQGVDRRTFLRGVAGVGLSALVAGSLPGCGSQSEKEKTRPDQPVPEGTPDVENFNFRLGEEEAIDLPGVLWVPDGHTSMMEMADGKIRVWVAGGPYSFMAEGKRIDSLNKPQLVFGPTQEQGPQGFEGYAAIHSVVPGANQGELIGFFHRELWPSQGQYFPFTAGIGTAVSKDNGLTWERQPKMIIEGLQPEKPPANGVSGAGQPSAIVKDNHVYLFFTDWTRPPDSIHVARARLDSVCKPQAWRHWKGDDWGRFGSEAESKPVVLPPAEWPNSLYSALSGVSYNRYLQKYLMVFETNPGFGVVTSKDLVNWSQPQLIMEFPQPQFPIVNGQDWYSYPTLLSDTASDRETDQSGWLIYSKGVRNGVAHTMHRRPFEII
jgi:hypothetical protein